MTIPDKTDILKIEAKVILHTKLILSFFFFFHFIRNITYKLSNLHLQRCTHTRSRWFFNCVGGRDGVRFDDNHYNYHENTQRTLHGGLFRFISVSRVPCDHSNSVIPIDDGHWRQAMASLTCLSYIQNSHRWRSPTPEVPNLTDGRHVDQRHSYAIDDTDTRSTTRIRDRRHTDTWHKKTHPGNLD